MWTDKERIIAKNLSDQDTLNFLKKLFVTLSPSVSDALEKNIVALDDAEYGRLMKVKFLSGKENEARINLLIKLAKENTNKEGKAPIAPR